ncbi:ABC transporter ATP-binding protein [Streptococcus ratti]|uniref:ABC transporter, ATP-binding protein n=1 Tax=Streptococcus ratti FA-1 = DSM 20564 TaxID=699248 RepID=A0ABP2QY83_STRRT|nr:ABC transporter ATP-binding protein [Streptococcus ratti]EJN94020.1 putative ABC transporter, ATP-binding protein [Streptococcus ratti FA-1 = DSM 20564]EMP70131.1 ABC transporter ATP-binding protein [Streptococcus ratti FA-1 = DSM 20564]QEY07854.1 ABC transporter ATP-binding protein [Streptococcus ratti]VEI60324.1 ABC transporter ATP-binding protein [Streptococcus mutans]
MTEQLPLLQLHHVTKKFGKKAALDDISFKLPKGKIIGLLGPNGSGKTTLIKLANGLLQPTAGEIVVNGLRPCPETKSMISYLPDTSYLNDKMRVRDILRLFEDFYSDFDRQKAEQLLDDLAIGQDEKLKNLSKGNKEKVQLILVMSRKAQLYILDEPIGGVDPAAREYILRTIVNNYSEDASVLISTHLIADIEQILDEVIFINQGKIVLQETVDDLREKYAQSIDQIFRERFRA